uniref:Uncharacterized protein n=1 Tax=Globisporangium ultimum (strain ATCC 200006 / CBS 805.95 / DAOM BR144) TaxID=431595 RepID=K3WDG7_GLOUD
MSTHQNGGAPRPLAVQTAAEADGAELAALTSFDLPASPVRSPVGSESGMSVWVEETTTGEQRVHVTLLTDASVPPPPPDTASSASSHTSAALGSTSQNASLASLSAASSFDASAHSNEMLDFPLVLVESRSAPNMRPGRRSGVSNVSSAIVPFQKLQMDTNLNQTLLPYRSGDAPSGSSTPPNAEAASPASRVKTGKPFAWEVETNAMMANDFMNALRLGDLNRPQEPQLSVRLRGSRVELASASEEDDVDFMGPAENIKRLFKLPYSQARVSLAVHRVGNTLVVDGELDDSDLPAGFEDFPLETMKLQPAQSNEHSTQQSLLYEKFIYESAVQGRLTAHESTVSDEAVEGDGSLSFQQQLQSTKSKSSNRKKNSKKAKKKSSIAGAQANSIVTQAAGETDNFDAHLEAGFPPSGLITAWLDLTGDLSSSDSFETTYYWHTKQKMAQEKRGVFHILQHPIWAHDVFILGSQVLLFSNKEHPTVSLKLHDMDQDLSLITVLDYYLDNVIANIPELAICMHSKGLVRGYKLVETRQIPYMSGTGRPLFDIQDVSMNASMLLKFLQENCSRPNGTYWLYRKEGENSLRLYDVNVLSQGKQLKWKYMMAMLCYRFASRASRLMYSLASDAPRLQHQLQQRQRELLSTCMKLLTEISQAGGSAHSSICSSVSEQLADTYLRECDDQVKSYKDVYARGEKENKDADLKLVIESLEKAKEYLLESIRSFEECMIPEDDDATTSLRHEEGLDVVTEDNIDIQQDDTDEMDSFMDEERMRLQLKFSSTCLQMGHVYAKNERWIDAIGSILDSCKFLRQSAIPEEIVPLPLLSSDSHQIDDLLDKLDFEGVGGARLDSGGMIICSRGTELRCRLLELVGDMATQHPVEVTRALLRLYRIISGEEKDQLLEITEPEQRTRWMEQFQQSGKESNNSNEQHRDLLALSFHAYLRALSPCVDSELYFLLMKKLGNASNELGKYFLGSQHDMMEAFRWFERGCKIFNEIEDGINVALLCANLAHLHKILAQGKPPEEREAHYHSAIQLCNDALQHLKQNKAELELHRKVKGELALTYLVWAVSMANDFSIDCESGPLSTSQHDESEATLRDQRKQRENDVHKTFNKSLSLYAELEDPKQVASTHYQMASFHNRTISRELQEEQQTVKNDGVTEKSHFSATLKNRMEIARRHYEKALAYFGKVEVGKTFVLIHQELADLYAVGGRAEDMEHALLIMLNTYDAFNNASSMSFNSVQERDAMKSLAGEVVAKVKLILHQLIRWSNNASSAHAGAPTTKAKKLEMFKKMYKEVIYYDGHNAGSIVPMLGTLRAMYLL